MEASLPVLANICLLSFLALSAYVLLLVGEASFGQQAFFGIGAYVGGIATAMLSWHIAIALGLAMIIGGLMAGALSLLAHGLRGIHFSLATLAAAEATRTALGLFAVSRINEEGQIVGPAGHEGFGGIRYWFERGWSYQALVILIASLLALLLFTASRLLASPGGRICRIVGKDPELAQAMGIDVRGVKCRVSACSGAIAALGGCLYAHYNTYVEPRNFDVMLGIHSMAYSIIGGLATPWGTLLGVSLDVGLLEGSRVLGPYRMIAFGGLVAVVLLVKPQGLLDEAVWTRWKRTWHAHQ